MSGIVLNGRGSLGFAVFRENDCGFGVLAFSAVCGFQRFLTRFFGFSQILLRFFVFLVSLRCAVFILFPISVHIS